MKLSTISDVMDFNDKFHKLVNMAEKQNNFNAYGWLMRYMQLEEERLAIDSKVIDMIVDLKRIEEELEQHNQNVKEN